MARLDYQKDNKYPNGAYKYFPASPTQNRTMRMVKPYGRIESNKSWPDLGKKCRSIDEPSNGGIGTKLNTAYNADVR